MLGVEGNDHFKNARHESHFFFANRFWTLSKQICFALVDSHFCLALANNSKACRFDLSWLRFLKANIWLMLKVHKSVTFSYRTVMSKKLAFFIVQMHSKSSDVIGKFKDVFGNSFFFSEEH